MELILFGLGILVLLAMGKVASACTDFDRWLGVGDSDDYDSPSQKALRERKVREGRIDTTLPVEKAYERAVVLFSCSWQGWSIISEDQSRGLVVAGHRADTSSSATCEEECETILDLVFMPNRDGASIIMYSFRGLMPSADSPSVEPNKKFQELLISLPGASIS